jgi:2-amino-4-hydroxy-6-hydroxymethyldihydropteridine diphosphokinase
MTTAFIGLGSNLDDPARQVRRALSALDELPETRRVAASSLYGSTPMGPADQPDFINAVAKLDTRLSAPSLLAALQKLEHRAGRVRHRHWGERTLDLDILLFGDQRHATPALHIPHPGLTERAFVLVPLAEIAPSLQLPDGRSISAHLDALNRDTVWYHGPVVEGEQQ